ncbi:MAG TPA: AtpZ/AtpI family protein [Nitrospira sp.]|nr:AtpZ/AtpI family protein [Nitrospira sp.]
MRNQDELKRHVSEQLGRMQQADKDRPTLLAQTAYLGTLGLLFVLPVVLGAYLGRWLDEMVDGYSLRWTLSLIILGVALGAVNVYLFIKE